MNKTQRLTILSDTDIKSLYERPEFTDIERRHFFSLPDDVLRSLNIRDTNNKRTASIAYFIVQYGYFKAKHQFFSIEFNQVKDDLAFVMEHFLPNDNRPTLLPTRKVQREIKNNILAYFNFHDDGDQARNKLKQKLSELVKRTHDPIEMFDESIKYLTDERCVILTYAVLQDLIGGAIKAEEKRLIMALKQQIPADVKTALQRLLKKDDCRYYLITILQCDAKSFQKEEMTKELEKLSLCKPIYQFGQDFLQRLGLSQGMISYYADLIHLYQSERLKKIDQSLACVYMICYVQSRYERITNNAVQGFAYHVDKCHEESKQYAAKNLPDDLGPIESYETQIGQLMRIFTNKKIMRQNGPAIEKHAFSIMPEDTIDSVSDNLLKRMPQKNQREQALVWQHHKMKYHAMVLNLRPLFCAIDFDNIGDLRDLFLAYRFWKRILQSKKNLSAFLPSRVPMNHIRPKALREHFKETIKTKKGNRIVINTHQYEFYLYRALRENIKQHKIAINASIDYKSFEAEAKIPPDWKKTKEHRLQELNNKTLLKPIDTILNDLESILEPLIERTNRRAINGENEHIKITHHRNGEVSWTLPYPKKNTEIDNPFYDQLEIKTISEVFDFVEQECGFMRKLTRIKSRGSSNKQDYLAIKGVILANGTMQGINAFSKRSNLKYQRLKVAEENHIRLSTLRAAANVIIDKMIELPAFELYLLSGNLHGSVDGKKKKLRRKLLKARYSSKYFGTDIGLVLMTMSAANIPFATNIISPNEHESHFVYPMLKQNNKVIDPDIISTDTAGTNNINDLLYYLLDKLHAPCYRSIVDHAAKICGFNSPSQYKDLLIKPEKPLNKKLIQKEWPNMVPILYSLLSHDSKQEKIISQLSSHDYKSEVKDALWELNRIPKSIHILRYIDDPQYRRDIRISLNRGEALHQILDKIAAVGGGDFRGMSDMEVEIWNECMRFIALLIIYYNMNLLSKLVEMNKEKGNEDAITYLTSISPIASQHINIGGLYEFSEDRPEINVDEVVALMEKILEETLRNGSGYKKSKAR